MAQQVVTGLEVRGVVSTLFRFLSGGGPRLGAKVPPAEFERWKLVPEVVPVCCRHFGLAGLVDQFLEVMERRNRRSCAIVYQRDVFADNSEKYGALGAFGSYATPVPGAGQLFISGSERTAYARLVEKHALDPGDIRFGAAAIQLRRATFIRPETILNLNAAILEPATGASANKLFETPCDFRFALAQRLCQRVCREE